MSISSVAASIAALRQQPVRNPPSQPAGRPNAPDRKPDVITASAVASRQGELLNKLI